ncbi:hypothetical protein BLA29_014975, partial [Euroglyphus maynei]
MIKWMMLMMMVDAYVDYDDGYLNYMMVLMMRLIAYI